MKLACKANRDRTISTFDGLFASNVRFKQFETAFVEDVDPDPYDFSFQAATNLKDLLGFCDGGFRYKGASIAARNDKALGLQPDKSVPHDRSTDTELLSDHVFWQPHSGLQGLLDDGPAEKVVHGVCRSALLLFVHGDPLPDFPAEVQVRIQSNVKIGYKKLAK
jgi:hypothetical protein